MRAAALLALVLVLCGGCSKSGGDDASSGGGEAPASGESGRLELVAPAPPAAEAVVERTVQHLSNLTRIATPLAEICDEMGADLNAYHALAREDLALATRAELSPEDRARIGAAYDELAAVSTRCISDEDAREFNRALLETVGPLKQGSPPPTKPSGG